MIFKSIQIQNFLSIGTLNLNLQNRGLVMIEGKNYDNPALNNNGAGKSSVIEAIVFALYGRTLRGLRGDAVINRVVGKNMRICLEVVDDDNSLYQILRQRKCTNTAKYLLFKDGVNITPKSELDFDKFIVQLLQADYQIFTGSLLFSSESFRISSASDSDIKKAFDTILNLDVLAKSYENVKLKLKTALDMQSTYKGQIMRLTNKFQVIQTNIQDLITERDKFSQDILNKQKHYTETIGVYSEELATLNSELEDLYDDCDDTAIQLDTLNDTLTQFNTQLTELSEYQQEIAQLAQRIKGYELELVKLQSDVDVRQNKLELIQKQQDKLRSKCESIQNTIQTAREQIGQPCKTCGQLLTETSIESVVSEYKQQLNNLQQELAELKTAPIIRGIAEIQDQMNSIQQVLQQDKRLKQTYEDKLQSSQTIQQKQQVESQIAKTDKALVQLQADVKVKKTEIKQMEQKLADTQKQLKELQQSENPHEKAIQKFQSEAEDIQSELDTLTEELQQLEAEIPRLQFWEKGFSNQGIKSFILDDVTPFLNRQLNKYLAQLTSGQIEAEFSTQTQLKSGEYREKFTLSINNTDGGDQYQANSAGERKRIDLAVSLALQDLVASRASKQIDIALFDEIFDSLDENGIDGVINLLYELTETKSTILVISHNEYLKSYFTNILTIAKKGGISYEQSNS